MGKRWGTLAICILFVAVFLLCTSGVSQGAVTANKTLTGMTIDGNLNESGWNIATGVTKIISGTPNNTVTYGVLWDNNNLYIGVKVLDATLNNDSANAWDDDSIEIYIDANHNHGTTYDTNDRQYVKGYNDTTLWEKNNNTSGVSHGWAAISGGYSVELSIPWSNLGLTATTDLTIGFDIGNNDDDNNAARDSQLMWNGTGTNWTDTSAFGDCTLADNVFPTPTATSSPTATATSSVSTIPTVSPTATVTITPTTSSVGTVRYESENATYNGGGIATDHTGYSGTGFWAWVNQQGYYIQYTVNVSTAGSRDITCRYANGMGGSRTMSLYVNGTKLRQVTFNATANWDTWANKVDNVTLNAGSNTIKYQYDSGDSGNINIDYMDVPGGTTSASPTPTVSPTATVTPTTTVVVTVTPTATVTPTPSSNGVIGNTSEGTVTDTTTANYYNAFRYQASVNMTVNEIKMKIASANSGKLKCAIYSDNGGNPASFLVGTEERSNLGAGWQVLRLTNSYNLTGGNYYWLVSMKDSNYAFSATTVTSSNAWAALTYGTWPSTLPAKQGTADMQHCFYAYYNPSQPTPTTSPTATPTVTSTPVSGQMTVGGNFWAIGWEGWENYFKTGLDWSTTNDPWRPELISDLLALKTKCLRFMDWNKANDVCVTSWSERIPKTANHYNSGNTIPCFNHNYDSATNTHTLTPYGYTAHGVAYEWQIDLCNRIGADLWINTPMAADDNYITQLATLIKNNLNPNLKVYVEYANETWNMSFCTWVWCYQKAQQLGLQNINYGVYCESWWAYNVYASVRVFEKFEAVFGVNSPRVVKVLGGQVGYHWGGYDYNHMTTAQITILNNSTINPNHITINAYAMAPYTGGTNLTEGYAHNDNMLQFMVYAKNSLNGTGVSLICYEGGTDNYSDNWQVLQTAAFQKDLYIDYFNKMSTVVNGIFCQYTMYGNCWGLKLHPWDLRTSSPKWDGAKTWIDAHY